MGIAILAGILRAGAMTIMVYTLTKEDVSSVIPVVYTYPIFVALMAGFLLDEQLLPLHWLAITIVVAGAVLVSLRTNHSGSGINLGRSFYLLLVSSILLAGADVTSKEALNHLSFWNMYTVTALSLSLVFLMFCTKAQVFRKLKGIPGFKQAISLLGFNEVLALLGIVLTFWAIQEGPISLVSTIIASRPIFVFVFAVLLSQIYPTFLEWRPSRGTLVLRFVAITLVVGGISLIYQISM
jgi:drug/metabolite transporter (DMT)-like permease